MKVGDLVRSIPRGVLVNSHQIGIIIRWVRDALPHGAVWEVVWNDNEVEHWDEEDLEVYSQ